MSPKDALLELERQRAYWAQQAQGFLKERDYDGWEKASVKYATYDAAWLVVQALRKDDACKS